MLLLVDQQEVASVTVPDEPTAGYLSLFENDEAVIHNGKYFETGTKTHSHKQTRGMKRHGQGFLEEAVSEDALLLVAFMFEEIPYFNSVILRAASQQVFGDGYR